MQNSSLFEQSKKFTPGGVHSPVRSFKGLELAPKFFKYAKGAKFTDVEDKEYIDFCMSFGPLILGHQNPDILESLQTALQRGWSYGACEPYSLDLAEFLIEKISFIEQIRFVNSGTEAVMTALRLARGYTGKNKIIKFNGCYHGHVDSMLIKAGSGLAGTSESSSAGVPEGISKDTLILELGDLNLVKKCFDDHPGEIAAIIIEPLPANNGLLIQEKEFLQGLRDLTRQHDALLIHDEVISGFRACFGGMSEKLNIIPDIVTYGKIIGGGLPVGALAGSREIMESLAPVGNVYQAGTLSANPLAMVAGLETLKKLDQNCYQNLAATTQKITDLFNNWIATLGDEKLSETKVINYESLFWVAPKQGISRACDIPSNLSEGFNPIFKNLLDKGIYLAPNAYEVGFVSTAHDESIVDELASLLKV